MAVAGKTASRHRTQGRARVVSTNKKRRPVIMPGLNDRKLAGGYLDPLPPVTVLRWEPTGGSSPLRRGQRNKCEMAYKLALEQSPYTPLPSPFLYRCTPDPLRPPAPAPRSLAAAAPTPTGCASAPPNSPPAPDARSPWPATAAPGTRSSQSRSAPRSANGASASAQSFLPLAARPVPPGTWDKSRWRSPGPGARPRWPGCESPDPPPGL